MHIIYIGLIFTTLIIVLIKKKNISFLLVYFLSSVLYYTNAFVGEIFVGKLNILGSVSSYSVEPGFYIVLIINALVILTLISTESEKKTYIQKEWQQGEIVAMKIFLISVFLLTIYVCVTNGVFSRTSYNKSDLAESSGSIATYYKYLASFAFVYMFTKEDVDYSIFWKIIAAIPIMSTFLFGNRSFLIISIVAVLFNYVYKHCLAEDKKLSTYLLAHKKIVIFTAVLLFVSLSIKGVTGYLFTGNFEAVWDRLTDVSYYKNVFFFSEPNTISRNLNLIISNKYQVGRSTYLALWAYFIPFATGTIERALGVPNFTKSYQAVVYVDDTNNASTYLGEAYANGGYITVCIVVLLYLCLVAVLFKGYKRCKSNIMKTTFLLMGIDAAFYIQRNSMAFEFSRLRDYIYIAIAIYLLIGLFNKKHQIRL